MESSVVAGVSDTLAAALAYGQMGLAVFPCAYGNKRPLTQRGFLEATSERVRIESWWRQWPRANVAIATGAVSNLLVIDVDPRHGGEAGLERLLEEHGDLPDTAIAHTGGGGRHIYLRHPGGAIPCSNGRLADGVDIKADGGYVIAPPSLHPNGKKYAWDDDYDIVYYVPPAPCPGWLVDLLRADPLKQDTLTSSAGAGADDKPIPQGRRNGVLVALAGAMRRVAFDQAAILAALRQVNQRRCQPPLDEAEVAKIAAGICKYDPDRFAAGRVMMGAFEIPGASEPALVNLATVEAVPISWLWPGRVALGKLTVLAGDPGLGKSFIGLDLAGRVSTGGVWPDCPQRAAPAGSVLLLSAEDDPADTIKPRLVQMDADCRRIHVLRAVRTAGGAERSFDLSGDLAILEKAIEALHDCRLVIIDPISAYLGKTDGHSNSDIRGLLAPLAELAGQYQVALLAITHLNKAGPANPLYRTMGSLAFVAAARAVWVVARDRPETEQETNLTSGGRRRLMLPAKNNLAGDGTGLAYHLEHNRLIWEPTPLAMTAADFFARQAAWAEPCPTPARAAAVAFLKDLLQDGPVWADDIRQRAQNAGLDWTAITRAKKNLGVFSERNGFGKDSRCYWRTAEQQKISTPSPAYPD